MKKIDEALEFHNGVDELIDIFHAGHPSTSLFLNESDAIKNIKIKLKCSYEGDNAVDRVAAMLANAGRSDETLRLAIKIAAYSLEL